MEHGPFEDVVFLIEHRDIPASLTKGTKDEVSFSSPKFQETPTWIAVSWKRTTAPSVLVMPR